MIKARESRKNKLHDITVNLPGGPFASQSPRVTSNATGIIISSSSRHNQRLIYK